MTLFINALLRIRGFYVGDQKICLEGLLYKNLILQIFGNTNFGSITKS